MKSRVLFCLAMLSGLSVANAEQPVSFPEEEPFIDLVFPAEWEMKVEDGVLFAHPKEDTEFLIALAESGSDKREEAVAEVKKQIEENYENVKFEEPQVAEAGELQLMIINAKGEDEDAKTNIHVCMIAKEGGEKIFVLQCISSEAGFEAHGDSGMKVINSITLHGAKAPMQTYSYPNKEEPTFEIDIPADWKVKADESGAFIESANKQFTATILAIDTEHIMEATETIGKDVTARFESVEWNEGGKPKVMEDKETGMTLTSNHGVAVHADGTRHRLGLFQYAKVGSEKFYVVNTWTMEKTLPENEETIKAVMDSIRHE